MEEQRENENLKPEKEGYVPRPAWQVWLTRIGLVAFIIFLILYYANMFRGGQ